MANKRQLKKQIHYICGDIALECGIAFNDVPGINKDIIIEVIRDIARLQTETLNKTTFAFDKARRDYENKSQYLAEKKHYNHDAYRKLKVEFNEKILELVNKMNSALPKNK